MLIMLVFALSYLVAYIICVNIIEGGSKLTCICDSRLWLYPDGTRDFFPPKKIIHRFNYVNFGKYELMLRYKILIHLYGIISAVAITFLSHIYLKI